jgi:hypothetical protein
MVSWTSPSQLIGTGAMSLVSGMFGSFADRRETLSALGGPPVFDHSADLDEHGEFWFDFMADTGDGFDSTFTVASALAAPSLSTAHGDLPRGRILVLGGDEVYPTPMRDAYRDRLAGPFGAALPWSPPDRAPWLYAIPGNHDWYDGLSAFLRLFCQGRWIGGWRTRQTRSYFALKLPRGWWLFATDIQLDSDVDHPQLEFFRDVARNRVGDGDRIVLCTAEPSWSHQWLGRKDAFRTLAFFEQEVFAASGRKLAASLSGDLHNYHRYERPRDGLQRVTAGGGGAFLHPTHFLPEGRVELREGRETAPRTEHYEFRGAWPDHAASRRIGLRGIASLLLSKRDPDESPFAPSALVRSWGFAAVLAVVQLVVAWIVHSSGPAAVRDPLAWILGLGFLAILLGYCGATGIRRLVVGAAHFAAQASACAIAFLPASAASALAAESGRAFAAAPAFVLVFLALVFPLSALVFGLYLYVFQAWHREELFSFQGIPDWKNFLRLRIRTDGSLEIHPLGIRRAERAWKLSTTGRPGDPWIVPDAGSIVDRVEAIEPPVVIGASSRRGASARHTREGDEG